MTSIDDIIRLLEAAKNTPTESKKAAAPKKKEEKGIYLSKEIWRCFQEISTKIQDKSR